VNNQAGSVSPEHSTPSKPWLGMHGWCGWQRLGYSNMDIAGLVPMEEEAGRLWWKRKRAGLRAIPLEEMSVVDGLADARWARSRWPPD
jgi:hypothetical protein